MTVDYHLRNGVIGRLGSFWARQVDAATKTKATELSRVAGLSGPLSQLDAVAGYSAAQDYTLAHDQTFAFEDGQFSNLGQDLQAYDYETLIDALMALRSQTTVSDSEDSTPRPHQLSNDLPDFGTLPELSLHSDWYMVPTRPGLCPVTIATRLPGVRLVSGVDFFALDGFIILRDNPAEVFAPGIVTVPVAMLRQPLPNSYTLHGDFGRSGNTFIAQYQKQSASLVAFRRAAAEYCGLWVLSADDMPLRVIDLPYGTLYLMAAAGPRLVTYEHERLRSGTAYANGHVVGPLFSIQVPTWESMADADTITEVERYYSLPGAHEAVFSMDGVLPVKGLTWDSSRSLPITTTGQTTDGLPHVELEFDGAPEAVARMTALQRSHEIFTRRFLADEIALVAGSKYLDFATVLRQYYGDQLVACVFGPLPTATRERLDDFLLENKPPGCVLLVAHNHSNL